MAFTLEQIRRKIHVSLKGRRFGITHNDFLAGMKDRLRPVANATSDTTATALPGYGVHTVTTTTNDGWTLTDPAYAGVEVRLMTGSTSTGIHAITPAAATIVSSNGTAGSSISLSGVAASVTLCALTTASWKVVSITPITTSASYATVSS
jgi:hypothetical protein